MEHVHGKSVEQIIEAFHTTRDGLSSEQVVKNQEAYGKNELEAEKSKSVIRMFLEQFKDVLIIILLIAALISALLGDWESFIVITAVVIMNAILGTVQQRKAESSLQALKDLAAPSAKVLRSGTICVIPAKDVVVGDVVLLEAGDSICADGRVFDSASLQVNESALTGESLSVEKADSILPEDTPLADQSNMVHSGSFVTYGHGSFLVTATGMNTEVGKIATMLKSAKEQKTPLQRSMDEFGTKLSILILAICVVIFVLSVLRGQAVIDSFMFAVALAVAAIPEALSSIVTIVLSFGTQKMVKEQAIIRKLQAVEALGSVSVICSDKTGTLTQNKMKVCNLYTEHTLWENDFTNAGNPFGEKEEKLVAYSILCSDATQTPDGYVGDPTEIALLEVGRQYGMEPDALRQTYERLEEIPFDSDRKLMTTVHDYAGQVLQITKGAVDVLKERMNLEGETLKELLAMNEQLSQNGLRVLAVACKTLQSASESITEDNLEFVGLIAMMDPPREESSAAVAACKSAGIRPIMITGDHRVTASAIARTIGILEDGQQAVDGAVIDGWSDEELQQHVEDISVYARVTPEHKIRIVRAWQAKDKIVAMTGDGVNDAPALKQADVGVAMGITGTEVSKDAAAMVLADDNFATIVKAVENGRNIYANIRRAIQFLLSGNMAGIFMVLYASLLNLPVPFLPIHLLFINLLTDSLPAISLGLEPHKKSVMQEKPRDAKASILTKSFMLQILKEGFVISVATFAAYWIGLKSGIDGAHQTFAFATLCLARLFHGFNCKSNSPVLASKTLWNNKYLIGSFVVGVLLLSIVLFVPGIREVFGVYGMKVIYVAAIYGLAIGSLLVNQIVKLIVN
jgi:Ca2+-transporting ATPase